MLLMGKLNFCFACLKTNFLGYVKVIYYGNKVSKLHYDGQSPNPELDTAFGIICQN